MTPTEVINSINARLEELDAYEVDGEYLGAPLSQGAAMTASLILAALNLAQRPGIFRTYEGGVSVEWLTGDTFVNLEIPAEAPWTPEFFFHFFPDGVHLQNLPDSRIVARSKFEN